MKPAPNRASAPERGSSRRQLGFSLLEVLVAFAILAMSVGVLMQIFSGGMRNVQLSDQHVRASSFAKSLLARVGTEVVLAPGEQGGELESGMSWRLVMQPIEDMSLPDQPGVVPSPFGLMGVSVIVEWPAGRGDKRNLTVHSARLYTKPQ